MILDALWETARDLATGLGVVGLGILGYFLFVAVLQLALYYARGGEQGYQQREARKLPKEWSEWRAQQQRKNLRCIGGGRRGPEAPESVGRRSA